MIAFEMMEDGSRPETKEKLVLRRPERWSPEASNFLHVASWRTLKDIEEVGTFTLFPVHLFLTQSTA